MAPNTIISGFDVVNALIRAREYDNAHNELVRLTQHDEAANHIDRFVGFAVKLRKPDVMEAFLSDALPSSKRVNILFRLADVYQRLGNRKNAFRKLLELAKICADSPENLRRVAECAVKIGEYSFALEIRGDLLRNAPQDHSLALDVVEARIPLNKGRAYSELNAIMRMPDLPWTAWERAADLYERFGREISSSSKAAIRAIEKAIAMPDSGPEARYRLAAILTRKAVRPRESGIGAPYHLVAMLARSAQIRRVRKELALLLVECRNDPQRLRTLADLAFALHDQPLAQKLAEAQYNSAPADPECILYFARHMRVSGNPIQAQRLLSDLFHAERQCQSMSDRQWVILAEELSAIGDSPLAKEAIAEAVAREPSSSLARKLAVPRPPAGRRKF
jgi:tetratricopeptide (TPR) repeat protein